MLLDERSEFADNVALPGPAATTLIGDVMDLGEVRDLGATRPPLYLVIQVSVAVAGGTSVQFILASDSQEGIAVDGSESRHYLSDVFAVADLIQGFQLAIPIPGGDVANSVTPYERYLGVLSVGVGTQTAGNINAFLTASPPAHRSYPDAQNT